MSSVVGLYQYFIEPIVAFSSLKDSNPDSLISNCDDLRRSVFLPFPVEPVVLEIFIPVPELANYDISIGFIIELSQPLDITVLNISN